MVLDLGAEPYVVVGPSRRGDFERCPRQFLLARLLGVPGAPVEEGVETIRGVRLHEEMQRRHEDWAVHDEPQAVLPESRASGDDRLTAAISRHVAVCPAGRGASYEGGELHLLWAPQGEGFVLSGRIDALWRWPDGVLEVRDYKTGATGDDLSFDFGAAAYALLVAAQPQWRGTRHVIRVTYERLLDDPVEVSVDADAAYLRRALAAVRSFAQRLRTEGEWPPTPGDHCRWCAYRETCPSSAVG